LSALGSGRCPLERVPCDSLVTILATDQRHNIPRPPLGAGKELPRLGPSHVVPAARELFAQDMAVDEVIFINDGVVKLVCVEPDGRELIVGLRLAGSFLGSTSALMASSTPVGAVTMSRCRVQRFPAGRFVDLVRSDSELSWRLHRAHSHEIHDNIKRLTQTGSGPSLHRLEQVLRELVATTQAVAGPSETRLELPIRHYEIAALIAVTPEHLSRLLRHLESQGRIRLKAGVIVVPDPAKL